MSYRTPEDTARFLAAILKRSGQSRARISAQTIRKLSGRRRSLRYVFIARVSEILLDRYDWVLLEIASGGYGAIQGQALEGAKAVTAKRLLSDEERKAIKRGESWFIEALDEELGEIEDSEDPDDE